MEGTRHALKNGADPNGLRGDFGVPNDSGTKDGHVSVSIDRSLQEHDFGCTVLLLAIKSGNLDIVRTLVEAGADVNAPNDLRTLPIDVVSMSDAFNPAMQAGHLYRNDGGWTPLHLAVYLGQRPTVELLLAKGANPNATNPSGWTPGLIAGTLKRTDLLDSLKSYKANIWNGAVPPLSPHDGHVEIDSAGVPHLFMVWENTTEKVIDAFKATIECYDAYGKPVRHYLNKTSVSRVQSQAEIYPRGIGRSSSYMHGFGLLAIARVAVNSVHFQDGSTWEPRKGAAAPKMEAKLDRSRHELDQRFGGQLSGDE